MMSMSGYGFSGRGAATNMYGEQKQAHQLYTPYSSNQPAPYTDKYSQPQQSSLPPQQPQYGFQYQSLSQYPNQYQTHQPQQPRYGNNSYGSYGNGNMGYGNGPSYGGQMNPSMNHMGQMGSMGQMNPMSSMNPMGYGNGSNAGNGENALQHVLLVLYVKPHNDKPSQHAMMYALNHAEILVQDVTQVKPLPAWLVGVPTLWDIRRGQPFYGDTALTILKVYDTQKRLQSGAQNTIVVPTSHGQSVPMNYAQPFAPSSSIGVPVGASSTQISGASQVDAPLQQQDNEYYLRPESISEEDLNSYMQKRNQINRNRPVTFQPSLLNNGEYVTM